MVSSISVSFSKIMAWKIIRLNFRGSLGLQEGAHGHHEAGSTDHPRLCLGSKGGLQTHTLSSPLAAPALCSQTSGLNPEDQPFPLLRTWGSLGLHHSKDQSCLLLGTDLGTLGRGESTVTNLPSPQHPETPEGHFTVMTRIYLISGPTWGVHHTENQSFLLHWPTWGPLWGTSTTKTGVCFSSGLT